MLKLSTGQEYWSGLPQLICTGAVHIGEYESINDAHFLMTKHTNSKDKRASVLTGATSPNHPVNIFART